MSTCVKRSSWSVGALLLALLFIGNLQPQATVICNSELRHYQGAGFWGDPCTWDGFVAGASAVMCGMFLQPGACLSAFIAVERARYVDKCFA